MLPGSEVPKRLWNSGDDLHRMLRDAEGKRVDFLAQLPCELLHAQALESFAKCVGEAVNTVAVCFDGLALDVVQALANLQRSELVMIQE